MSLKKAVISVSVLLLLVSFSSADTWTQSTESDWNEGTYGEKTTGWWETGSVTLGWHDGFDDGSLDDKWTWTENPNSWDEDSTVSGQLWIDQDGNYNVLRLDHMDTSVDFRLYGKITWQNDQSGWDELRLEAGTSTGRDKPCSGFKRDEGDNHNEHTGIGGYHGADKGCDREDGSNGPSTEGMNNPVWVLLENDDGYFTSYYDDSSDPLHGSGSWISTGSGSYTPGSNFAIVGDDGDFSVDDFAIKGGAKSGVYTSQEHSFGGEKSWNYLNVSTTLNSGNLTLEVFSDTDDDGSFEDSVRVYPEGGYGKLDISDLDPGFRTYVKSTLENQDGNGEPPELHNFTVKTGTPGICDRRGSKRECIVDSEKEITGETHSVNNVFESSSSSIFSSRPGEAKLEIFNNSFISGVWTGNFNITSRDTVIRPGAEFKPSDRIIIGERNISESTPSSCGEVSSSGVYDIDPDGDGESVKTYCDMQSDGGSWTMVASNYFNDSTLPTDGYLRSDSYQLNRSEHLYGNSVGPNSDYIIGEEIEGMEFDEVRITGWGWNSVGQSSTGFEDGYVNENSKWLRAQWTLSSSGSSRFTESTPHSSLDVKETSGMGFSSDSNYYVLDAVAADSNDGYDCNNNQCTVGAAGVKNKDGNGVPDPGDGTFTGHGEDEGSYEGWYASSASGTNSQGYVTWVR